MVDLIKTTPVTPASSSTPSLAHSTSPSSSSTSLSSLLSTPFLEAHAIQRRTKLTTEQFAEYCSVQTCHRSGKRGHIQRQCILPSPGGAGHHGSSSSTWSPPAGPFGTGSLMGSHPRGGDGSRSSDLPHGEYRGSPSGGDGHLPNPAGTRQLQNHCVT